MLLPLVGPLMCPQGQFEVSSPGIGWTLRASKTVPDLDDLESLLVGKIIAWHVMPGGIGSRMRVCYGTNGRGSNVYVRVTVLYRDDWIVRVCERQGPWRNSCLLWDALDYTGLVVTHNIRYWWRVHFSDESRFNYYDNDGSMHVWRSSGKRLHPACVHWRHAYWGAFGMVWGCISLNCKLPLVEIQGNINARRYCNEVLNNQAVPHLNNHLLQDQAIFMHDGATPHTANVTKYLLRREAVDGLDWPSRSPDLNPIENVWDFIKRELNNPNTIIVSCKWVHELVPKLFVNWCGSTKIFRSHLKMCSSSKDSLSILTKSCVR